MVRVHDAFIRYHIEIHSGPTPKGMDSPIRLCGTRNSLRDRNVFQYGNRVNQITVVRKPEACNQHAINDHDSR